MAKMYEHVYMGNQLIASDQAALNIASSAVLYGLSVYTVFNVDYHNKKYHAFRLNDHFKRLVDSCRIIGITTFESEWNLERFTKATQQVIHANNPQCSVFMRASVHVDERIPGTKSRGLHNVVSLFAYEALPIVPQSGARLKTSVWRRIPDYSIPSRAKVNGAYVNSVLAKQDAIDSGYDDCIFLDSQGHVCELSAANIFMVRGGQLYTPDNAHDLLEGINRRTIIELASDVHLPVAERAIDLTELYIADEVFICGTSAYVAPVQEIDGRIIGNGKIGPITKRLQDMHRLALCTPSQHNWLTTL